LEDSADPGDDVHVDVRAREEPAGRGGAHAPIGNVDDIELGASAQPRASQGLADVRRPPWEPAPLER
jgi:hypothetical protein